LRTAAIFLLFALVANGSEYAILSGGIGLSGVGYGLFGLLWVLSRRHPKFAGVVDTKTISLFVIWFFACIVMTAAGMPIGNIAHGAGAAIGALLGYTIISAGFRHRVGEAAIAGIVLAVMLGATMARPWINLSADRGDDEARLGYAALIAGRNDEALRWYRDATRMKPKTAGSWFNLGITLERLNRESESSAAYNRAYELEPSNPAFQSMALSRGNSRAIR
jgi:tetratricopeptide (TPR) repeat protein